MTEHDAASPHAHARAPRSSDREGAPALPRLPRPSFDIRTSIQGELALPDSGFEDGSGELDRAEILPTYMLSDDERDQMNALLEADRVYHESLQAVAREEFVASEHITPSGGGPNSSPEPAALAEITSLAEDHFVMEEAAESADNPLQLGLGAGEEATEASDGLGALGGEAATEASDVPLGLSRDEDTDAEHVAARVFASPRLDDVDASGEGFGGFSSARISAQALSYAPTDNLKIPMDVLRQQAAEAFPDMATEILREPMRADLATPMLLGLRGPGRNQRMFLLEARSVIGRGPENAVPIADAAMSREHFEVARDGERFIMRDLGSANGTYLNGIRVREGQLFHGDTIEAGKSALKFDFPEALERGPRHIVPIAGETLSGDDLESGHTSVLVSRVDRGTRLFTFITIVAGVLCLPLIGLLGWMVVSSPSRSAQKTPGVAPTAVVAPNTERGGELYLLGVESVKNREWDQAEAYFKRARAHDESLDIAPQLARVTKERAAASDLLRARELTVQSRWDAAATTAAKIPQGSAYFADATQLIKQSRRAQIASLYEQAQRQFTEDTFDGALAALDDILKQVPEHEGALKLRQRVVVAKEEQAREDARKAAAAAAASRTPARTSRAASSVQLNDPFSTSSSSKSSSKTSKPPKLNDPFASPPPKRKRPKPTKKKKPATLNDPFGVTGSGR